MKNKSKYKKNSRRLKIRQCSTYEPDFKKAVVLYAEQKSTREAKKYYGISESNIRRWRRLRHEIMEKAAQPKFTRRSTRPISYFEGSCEDYDDYSSSLDSMPLELRLKTAIEPEPVLQSQPLSPTKLKVTRQTAKPPAPSPKPATPEPPNEEVCLRWNSHHSNMQTTFPNLLLKEQYVDATLVAEGQTLKCHRLILSSCSPYFEEILSGISPFQHPVLFMRDIPFWILKSLCDFMYAGEVHIFQNKLEELLAVAETLKIKGLAGKTNSPTEEAKKPEPAKVNKEEKKEDREPKDKKKQQLLETPQLKGNSNKGLKSTNLLKKPEKTENIHNNDVLDPLDLLEPVYEELTKESKPPIGLGKFKESKNIPLRKSLPKKIKKRKLSEEREESPPPLFLSRKGTRSRPNVKVPKYYHTHYERVAKSIESPESTIVREPHTDQPDPLLPLDEIKAEPLDPEVDVIEIEDNVVNFSDHDMPLQDEEIIGHYDSPFVNINDGKNGDKEDDTPLGFKKINLVSQPIIMDVHSVGDKSQDAPKVVDIAPLPPPEPVEILELGRKIADDPLNVAQKDTEKITITNIQTVPECDVTTEDIGGGIEMKISKVVSETKPNSKSSANENSTDKVKNKKEETGDVIGIESKKIIEDDDNATDLGFHIAQVVSEETALREENKSANLPVNEECGEAANIASESSGHLEKNGLEKERSSSELETLANDLSEMVAESHEKAESNSGDTRTGVGESLSIAESLEKLLEK